MILARPFATASMIALLVSLAACGAPPSSTSAAPECRPGERDAVSRVTGAHHCIIPHGDYVNVTPGCQPQAVQAFYDWGTWGDGGAGALACSVAGEAVCADDRDYYEIGMAEAVDAGVDCPFR